MSKRKGSHATVLLRTRQRGDFRDTVSEIDRRGVLMSKRQRDEGRAFTPVCRRRRYSARHLCRVRQDAQFLLSCPHVCQPGSPGSLWFAGRSPVNRADTGEIERVDGPRSTITRHECRADYRLKPGTGVNARRSLRMRSQSVTASSAPIRLKTACSGNASVRACGHAKPAVPGQIHVKPEDAS